jgi:hypothetical protein
MSPQPRFDVVQSEGEVVCVRLHRGRMDEADIHALIEQLIAVGTASGCRRLVLSLGPRPPVLLYSVFLAKLITLHRVLREHGSDLVLCHVPPEAHAIFEACQLDSRFHFADDFEAATALSLPG